MSSRVSAPNSDESEKTAEAEAMFNLIQFVETLIKMDRQHLEWLEAENDKEANSKA